MRETRDLSVTAPQDQNSTLTLQCMTGVVAGMQHQTHNHNREIIGGTIGGVAGLYLVPPALFALCGKGHVAAYWLASPLYVLAGIGKAFSSPC